MKVKAIVTLSTLLLFLGCAKEFDRIPFDSLEQKEKTISISQDKKVQLWVDLDVEYSGDFSLLYDVALFKDGQEKYTSQYDAMNVNVKMNSSEMTLGDNHKLKYQGKLGFNSKNIEPGEYKLVVKPIVNGNYSALNKYDIVLKQ